MNGDVNRLIFNVLKVIEAGRGCTVPSPFGLSLSAFRSHQLPNSKRLLPQDQAFHLCPSLFQLLRLSSATSTEVAAVKARLSTLLSPAVTGRVYHPSVMLYLRPCVSHFCDPNLIIQLWLRTNNCSCPKQFAAALLRSYCRW